MLVLRTANGSSVEPAAIIGLETLKPPTDFYRGVREQMGVRWDMTSAKSHTSG
jgi:hypothetical protein